MKKITGALSLEQAQRMMAENGGNLDLHDTAITSLPEGLTVAGWLDLEGCTAITALPENLSVGSIFRD